MKRVCLHGLILAIALTGCQSHIKNNTATTLPAQEAAAISQSSPAAAAPSEPSPAPARSGFATPPPANVLRDLAAPQKDNGKQRYDIAVHKQDVREFFLGLVQTMGQNIVVHPDVQGNISLYLQDVTLVEVLTAVNDMYGYDYERNEYGYVILPAILNTRVFTIDYLNIDRQGSSNTRVSSGEMTSTNDESTDSSGSSTSSTSSTVRDSTSINTSNSNDFWTDLKAMLSMLVDITKGGMVMVNAQSGLVVVRGLPHELRSIDNFLKRAQLSLDREVVLEAKIIEVTLRDRFQAGIDWSIVGELTNSSSTIAGTMAGVPLSNPDLIGGVFGVTIASNDFNSVIELLETQGDVSVLSSPRIATVNNQKAAIKVGTEEFFVTDVKSTTTSGVSVTQTPEVTLTPFFSGIVLDVTPQISDDNYVVLHVHPSVTEVKDQVKEITLGTQDISLPLAHSTVREADSVVRAQSNQIVLIGGLMSNLKKDVETKVPWLSDLPVLGMFFKQIREDELKSELVILLRPIITDNNKALPHGWSSERLRDADREFTDGPWLQPTAAGNR
jgi:MSHA biogenesis protein MshL